MMDLNHKKVLIIRADNIGDLVCTTPVFSALKKTYPHMQLDVLVNSYNLAVLFQNPDIDHVYYYTKAKHRGKLSLFSIYWHRLKTLMKMRHTRYEYVILAGVDYQHKGVKHAKQIGNKNIVGYCRIDSPKRSLFAIPVDYYKRPDQHEVESVFDIIQPLGISGKPGPLTVIPEPDEVAKVKAVLKQHHVVASQPIIGIHISSRKPRNRWPESHFINLIQQLWDQYHYPLMLFWSPGDEHNPLHPGDDQKAQRIVEALPKVKLIPYRTTELPELIAGMSLCQSMVCCDGGAMHIAAALVKFMVALFGCTNVTHWHPWGLPQTSLTSATQHAKDISVKEVLSAYQKLAKQYEQKS